MSASEIGKKLQQAVFTCDSDLAKKAAEEAIASDLPPLEAVLILTDAIREVGTRFAKSECFLADLVMSADAMRTAMKVITPKIPKDKVPNAGTILMGTVRGDIHDIGKNIVISMLTAEGFDVHDLGMDVPPSRFAEEAESVSPSIIGASALMTTSKPVIAELVEYLQAIGVRGEYKIMIGGAPITQEYASAIGADGYARDAVEASELAKRLMVGG